MSASSPTTPPANAPLDGARVVPFVPAVASLVALEFRKLFAFRSLHLGAIAAFILPFLLSFAPDGELAKVIGANLVLVNGWQVPGLSLYIVMQFVLPLLVSVTCAELIGGEVAWGTLAPLLLRPVSRLRVVFAKIVVAVLYPLVLLAVTLAGGIIAGLRFGLGSFAGGTGLGPGAFTGVGMLGPLDALGELARGYLIAGLTLAPIAVLAVAFAAVYLNTAAASLGTIATILLMRLLVVFPAITPFLLTTHLNAYAPGQQAGNSLILLALYAIGAATATLFFFERKDL